MHRADRKQACTTGDNPESLEKRVEGLKTEISIAATDGKASIFPVGCWSANICFKLVDHLPIDDRLGVPRNESTPRNCD